MILRQLTDTAGGCASYLLGCPRAGEALVVDALGALGSEEYLLEAADRGLAIRWVIDTHIHADHRSAGRELAELAGAAYCLGEATRGAGFAFRALRDGELLRVGAVQVQVLATPGHTLESISLLVTDTSRCAEPWCVLTGDTLLVGDVGRPDLLVGEQAAASAAVAQRAHLLWHSVHGRLLSLPAHVEVYPGHFGGSACGGVHLSGKPVSTVGFEQRFNLALQHADPAAFAAFVGQTLRPAPPGYQRIKRRNLGLEEAAANAGP